jgi:CMP-N,N'-diacetyllegionaminic acid synthase
MDCGMNRIAVICARGGSKGVKGKNLRTLAGKPLIAHSILQAKESGMFSTIAVSSDSEEILRTATEWGADFAITRPDELASDTAPKVPAIRHCAETAEAKMGGEPFDTIVDLDATAPLRSIEDIRGAIELLEASDANNVVTGMPARRSPYFNLVERDDTNRVHIAKTLDSPLARRQDSPACFDLNASVFVWTRDTLYSENNFALGDNTLLYEMPEERSIDIDSETDFRYVEFLMSLREAAA